MTKPPTMAEAYEDGIYEGLQRAAKIADSWIAAEAAAALDPQSLETYHRKQALIELAAVIRGVHEENTAS